MTIGVKLIPEVADVRYLDDVLLEGRRMRLLPAAAYREYPHDHLLAWLQARGRYGVPTVELVEFLRGLIGDRKAIEIGSGMGDLGWHLGIPMTDSHVQMRPEYMALYSTMDCQPIVPPAYVERADAFAAIKRYKPDVVVALWVTQLYRPGDEKPPKVGSCVDGVDEMKLIKRTAYIFVGNKKVHGDKRILQKPHREYQPEGLVSRGHDQSLNVVWTWGLE